MFEPPISTSNLYAPDFDRLCQIFDEACDGTGQLQSSQLIERLEQHLCDYHESAYCVTFSTGFWALVAAVRLKSLPNKSEVIIPSLTYRRLADVVYWCDRTPHFVDVDPNTLAICPDAVERALSPDTSLILAVHPIVGCCDVDALLAVAERNDVPIIFDAVESVHESIEARRVGSFGVGEVFSFHASKLINGLEGGYVCTNDATFASQLRTFRASEPSKNVNHDQPLGLSSELNAGHAAFAIAGLEEIAKNVEHNKSIYQTYLREAEAIDGFSILKFDERETTSFKNIVAEVLESYPLNRDELVARLNSVGILARAHYSPALHEKSYEYPVRISDVPVSNRAVRRLINLPCGQRVTESDVVAVCRYLKTGVAADRDRLPVQDNRPNLTDAKPESTSGNPVQQIFHDVFRQIYKNNYFTNHGPLARQFESSLERHLSISNVVTIGNESLALLIALAGLGIKGEVLLPAFDSQLLVEITKWLGLQTKLYTLNSPSIDPSLSNPLLMATDDTEAIIWIEREEQSLETAMIESWCNRGLKVIIVSFDSFPVQPLAGDKTHHSDVVKVYSFGPDRLLTTLEGGAIATTDDELAEKFRNIRSSYGVRLTRKVKATCNGRFSEFQAGVGIKNLEQLVQRAT